VVLTGSTNFSMLSLHTQWNYVVLIRNPSVADAYERYFQYAAERPKVRVPKQPVDLRLTTPQIRILFTPSDLPVDALVAAIRQAKSSILFFLQEGVAPEVLQAIASHPKLSARLSGSIRSIASHASLKVSPVPRFTRHQAFRYLPGPPRLGRL
jgi:hypothetical protein